MYITVEISLYPLHDGYGNSINEFLKSLQQYEDVQIQTTAMSTILAGSYETIMNLITREIKPVFKKNDAVFTIKIANACGVP